MKEHPQPTQHSHGKDPNQPKDHQEWGLEEKLSRQEVMEGFQRLAFAKHQEAHHGHLEIKDIVPVAEKDIPPTLHHDQDPNYEKREEHRTAKGQKYTVETVAGAEGAGNADPGTHASFFCKKCQGALFEIAVKNNHALQLITAYVSDDEKEILQEAAQNYDQREENRGNTSSSYDRNKRGGNYNPLTGVEDTSYH